MVKGEGNGREKGRETSEKKIKGNIVMHINKREWIDLVSENLFSFLFGVILNI